MSSKCYDAVDLVTVSYTHIVNLLKFYWDKTYNTATHGDTEDDILNFVELLWTMDYSCLEISNPPTVGVCDSYPLRIFVPDAQMKSSLLFQETGQPDALVYDDELKVCVPKKDRTKSRKSEYEVLGVKFPANAKKSQVHASLAVKSLYQSMEFVSPLHDSEPKDIDEYFAAIEKKTSELQTLMDGTKFSRSRNRIVVPVILYKGVYVARSATIPMEAEFWYRKGVDAVNKAWEHLTVVTTLLENLTLQGLYDIFKTSTDEAKLKEATEVLSKIDLARLNDANFLKYLKINTVFDLMVEDKKICYNIYTASSEKALFTEEKNYYAHMDLNRVPYPGCEFFAEFAKYLHSEQLQFDWASKQVNSSLYLESKHLREFQVDGYRDWSLDRLTKHYLLIMLTHLKKGENLKETARDRGLLVHCISGWDRTPLFVSLLRISLWADVEIHKSFDCYQMLYFTLAYDWMFFCHNMKGRSSKDELVLFFCFYFLKFIKGKNFNITSSFFGMYTDKREFCDSDDSFELIESVESGGNIVVNDSDGEYPHKEDSKLEATSEVKTDTLEEDAAKPLAEKLKKRRGVSSPGDPSGTSKVLHVGKEFMDRYKRITKLRQIFFAAFKKSLPDASGLGVMESDYDE